MKVSYNSNHQIQCICAVACILNFWQMPRLSLGEHLLALGSVNVLTPIKEGQHLESSLICHFFLRPMLRLPHTATVRAVSGTRTQRLQGRQGDEQALGSGNIIWKHFLHAECILPSAYVP